jgi:hypothetical protein
MGMPIRRVLTSVFFLGEDFHDVARKEMDGADSSKLGLGIFFWLKMGPSCHIMSEKKI